MDRRTFIKAGAASLAAASVGEIGAAGLGKIGAPAREGIGTSALGAVEQENAVKKDTLLVKFLGTGASGGTRTLEMRRETGIRQSSILLDRRIQIDLTVDALDLMGEGFVPECVFYTHSHGDHYDPALALKLGVKTVYVGESWQDRAWEEFRAAALEAGKETGMQAEPEMPEVIPLKIGRPVRKGDITITPLPANHDISYLDEEPLIFLIEKAQTRLLYATDTSALPARAIRIAGLSHNDTPGLGQAITGLIMDSTVGFGSGDRSQIFGHSSVDMVQKTYELLECGGHYLPHGAGEHVYLTHRGYRNFGKRTPDEIDAILPSPLKAARDGSELEF